MFFCHVEISLYPVYSISRLFLICLYPCTTHYCHIFPTAIKSFNLYSVLTLFPKFPLQNYFADLISRGTYPRNQIFETWKPHVLYYWISCVWYPILPTEQIVNSQHECLNAYSSQNSIFLQQKLYRMKKRFKKNYSYTL